MTLVEVVIALGVFGITFLGVTMCLSAALKLTNRNMLRDRELNTQQKVIEEHQVHGVALSSGHTINGDKIIFGTGTGAFNMATGKGYLDNVTMYHAIKTADHGEDYNFELKGISSTRNPLGNAAGDYDRTAGKYCLHVINNSTKSVDVTFTLNSGYFYEGNFTQGYKHNSSVYGRTIPAKDADAVDAAALPAELQVGYYSNPGGTPDDVTVSWIREDGATGSQSINTSGLSAQGAYELTINDTGVSVAYKTP